MFSTRQSRFQTIATGRTLRIVLFAPNLHGGGAERTLARLASHWASQGHTVTLVTLAAASPEDFSIPVNVIRVGLGLTAEAAGPFSALRNNLERIRALRDVFRTAQPDIVVSFIEQANVLALLAARPLSVPVVISERTDPERHVVSRVWQFLRRWTYPRCAALVVLTDEIAEAMRPLVHGRPVVVIPNGVAASTVECDGQRSAIILGVGRLDPAKGFDRLIEAFAHVAGDYPVWKLVIIGDGPQRRVLEQQIADARLEDRIALPGRIANPASRYAEASIFALPSRYEGFPNALLEAMAHGLPVVAFDGPSAVRQIVRHEIDGLLVPNGETAALEHALRRLMGDADLRRQVGMAAREVVGRFSLATFFDRWDRVIEDFCQLFDPQRE